MRKPRNVNRAIGDTRLSLSIWWRLLRSGRRKGAENERGKLSFLSLALLNIFARAVAPRPPRRTHNTLNTHTTYTRFSAARSLVCWLSPLLVLCMREIPDAVHSTKSPPFLVLFTRWMAQSKRGLYCRCLTHGRPLMRATPAIADLASGPCRRALSGGSGGHLWS